MATQEFYQTGDRVICHITGLTSGSDSDLQPKDWNEDNVDVETYVVGGACDIKQLVDSAGDFASPDSVITLDSFSSDGVSEGNRTPLQADRVGLRISNTSGSTQDYVVVGRVVRDRPGGE